MNPNSIFFEKNKELFKSFIQERWLFLSKIEFFLLDKQAKYSVQKGRTMYDKICTYLQVVSNIRGDVISLLYNLYNDVDIQDEFYRHSKEITALYELVKIDFDTESVIYQ